MSEVANEDDNNVWVLKPLELFLDELSSAEQSSNSFSPVSYDAGRIVYCTRVYEEVLMFWFMTKQIVFVILLCIVVVSFLDRSS